MVFIGREGMTVIPIWQQGQGDHGHPVCDEVVGAIEIDVSDGHKIGITVLRYDESVTGPVEVTVR